MSVQAHTYLCSKCGTFVGQYLNVYESGKKHMEITHPFDKCFIRGVYFGYRFDSTRGENIHHEFYGRKSDGTFERNEIWDHAY